MRIDEDDLRRVLEAEAQRVEIRPDALGEIRRRIAARRARWFPRRGFVFAVGAAAMATAVIMFASFGGCAPQPSLPPPPIAGATSTPPSTAATTTPSATASVPPGPGATAAVPVYYVHGDRGFPRLYREFHQLNVPGGTAAEKTRVALVEMLDGLTAYDKDYYSLWPAGTGVRGVRIEGDAVVVDLSGVRNGPRSGERGIEDIKQSVQQLIWTATAASGLDTVRLLLDGQPASSLWGVAPVAGDLHRAPAMEVLGLVWVRSPQQGQTVGRTFQVDVSGIVFEATMRIRVRQGSKVITDRMVMLSTGPPDQGNASISLTLAPGSYTIEGYEVSMADSSEQHLDDHQFTVK